MAKDKQKKAQTQRHDPLHVQLNEENDFTHAPIRKQRQKFVARNNRAEDEQEVWPVIPPIYRPMTWAMLIVAYIGWWLSRC